MEIKSLAIAENEKKLEILLEQHSDSHEEVVLPYEPEPVSLAAFEGTHYLGGLTGTIVWNHLHISLLGVDTQTRQGGIGSALLKAAEKIALERGCHLMIVETMSWQAPGFYEKNGFTSFGQVESMPKKGQKKIYLVKYLT